MKKRAIVRNLAKQDDHEDGLPVLTYGEMEVQEANGDVLTVKFSRYDNEKEWVADSVYFGTHELFDYPVGKRETPHHHILTGWVAEAVNEAARKML